MLMQEFILRFKSEDESSTLFQILRRISHVDTRILKAASTGGWIEWPPVDDPSAVGIGIARA